MIRCPLRNGMKKTLNCILVLLAVILITGDTASTQTPQRLTKIVLVQGTQSLLYTPIYVARAKNLFKMEGLDVDVVITGGGAKATAALLGGSAQVAAAAFINAVDSARSGKPLIAFAALMDQYANKFVIRKDIARQKGITEQSPVDDRIAALRGLKIGITSAGSATDDILRYVLSQKNLDPERDVEIIALRASGAALAALKRGQVHAILFPSPAPDQAIADGDAVALLDLSKGELPAFRGFLHMVLITTKENITREPQVLTAVTRAIWRAQEFIQKDRAGTKAILQGFFRETDPRTLDLAFESNYPAYARNPGISTSGVEAVFRLLAFKEKEEVKVSFNQVATNHFVGEAEKLMKRGK